MRPGLLKVLVGATLFILGIAAIPVMVILPLLTSGGMETKWAAPGRGTVGIEKAGRHYLWHEFEGVFDGRRHRAPEYLPMEWKITVVDADGEEILFMPDTSVSITHGTTRKRSIGHFRVNDPGEYTVSASGDGPSTVLAVSRFNFGGFARQFLSAFVIGFTASAAGIVFLIVGVAQLTRKQNAPATPPLTPTPPPPAPQDRKSVV